MLHIILSNVFDNYNVCVRGQLQELCPEMGQEKWVCRNVFLPYIINQIQTELIFNAITKFAKNMHKTLTTQVFHYSKRLILFLKACRAILII